MQIDGLPRAVQQALPSLSKPSRYLYPGPDGSVTGSLSESILLIGAGSNCDSYNRPGFHRTYRRFDALSERYVEHFIHPETDFFQMTQKKDVEPWALESRRSIFSFPTWFVYLSWSGDGFAMKDLFQQLTRYERFQQADPTIAVLHPPSFLFSELVDEYVDLTLPGAKIPREPDALETCIDQITGGDRPPEHVLRAPQQSGSKEDGPLHSQLITPIPSFQSELPDRCWIGSITAFNQNHTLQTPSWPTFTYPSPSDTLRSVVNTIDSTGMQCLEIGQVQPVSDRDRTSWQLELLERFHSQWGARPICYQLDNPRPDHPVWAYKHLLKRYNHTPLDVHLGTPEERRLQQAGDDQIENWLNHFLSCGGPKMSFRVDIKCTQDQISRLVSLCQNLESINQAYIDGKAQIRVLLQPQLSDPSAWKPPEQFQQVTEQLSEQVTGNQTTVSLDLPDDYERMRQYID